MEKFYIVTEESILHKDFYAYRANIDVVNELYKAFTAEHGIEATEYYVANDAFYIVPTDTDNDICSNPLAIVSDVEAVIDSELYKETQELLRQAGYL